jgi:hypothetical protein
MSALAAANTNSSGVFTMTTHVRTTAMLLLFVAVFLAMGCGAGQYGFSRYYEPLSSEEPYQETSREFTYGAVTARPHDFEGQLIAWFGIVEKVYATRDDRSLVHLTFHKHKNRHLCEGETSSTCRVTVHHKATGGFSAVLKLEPKDKVPSLDKVQPGTLMRVFGKVRCVPDANGDAKCDRDKEGGVILYGVYYRHWPARYYRTTRAAVKMVR